MLDLAEAQLGEHDRSQRAAFEDFLSKPFDREVLVNTVDGVVEDSVRSALSISMQCAQTLDR